MARPTSTFGLIKQVVALRWQKMGKFTKLSLTLAAAVLAMAATMRVACGLCGSCSASSRCARSAAPVLPAADVEDVDLPEDTERTAEPAPVLTY